MLPLSTAYVTILPEFYTHFGMATEGMFGGNVLANRGDIVGPGSYDDAINGLNVTGLRYPGGALTEKYFDITNPDASVATNSVTGETSTFIPISEFLAYAGTTGQDVTIVIPTRGLVSEDPNSPGEWIYHVDQAETVANLRKFVNDVTTGVYGDANIVGFELGNEYWGSGNMNAVEYGHVASKMAVAIHDELQLVSESYDVDTSGINVLVQSGFNFGKSTISDEYVGWESQDVINDLVDKYSGLNLSYENIRNNGEVNWTDVNNELIILAFDTLQEKEAMTGVLGHVYSYGTDRDDAGAYQLGSIENAWLATPDFEDLDIHVTEWNLKTTDGIDHIEDYGLFQGHEMLHIMENFIFADVETAFVWPLIQNTPNALSTGMEYSGPTAPGQFFSMMSANLPGKAVIDFAPDDYYINALETDVVDVHAFAGRGDMVLYLVSNAEETATTYLDLTYFITGFDAMEVSVLGVTAGQNPGTTGSDIDVQQPDSSEIYQDGILEADLDHGEIMQVIIHGIVPTDAFKPTLEAIDMADMTTITQIIGDETGQAITGTVGADNIEGNAGWDWIFPNFGSDTIDGGTGRDTVSYSDVDEVAGRGTAFMLDLDLGAGTTKFFDGEVDQLTNIERATGSIYADVLRGTDGYDELRGIGDYDWFVATTGNDTLDGGNGLDMITFAEWGGTDAAVVEDIFSVNGAPPVGSAAAGITLDLSNPGSSTGLAQGLKLISVEQVTGSSYQDVFFGDGNENDFRGLGGYDWFVGSTGGRERYFGGDGLDTVTYYQSTSGISASLRNGAGLSGGQETGYGSLGDAVRDLYFEIENLVGTEFDDNLTGNNERNQLSGLDGDDFIFGYGGTDYMKGGAGDDTINGGAGSDFALYDGNLADYTLTRTSATDVVIAGADGTDSLSNVEYFQFDDTTANIWELAIV